MFFVNSDLKKASSQKSLGEVVKDEGVKVAYGVLSLKSFLDMVKGIGSSTERIHIPKVQRGLVWKTKGDFDPKKTFVENCITGNKKGVIEPMPNIFLFCDAQTGEIQLFDGLQRTAAILEHEKLIITGGYEVMIPAALFKGNRVEAENLFRHINDRGVKLNDFEKLASFGGNYELNANKFDDDFKYKFDDFVKQTTKDYTNQGLTVTQSEKTTLYEILMYAIYEFSKIDAAKKIFRRKETDKSLVFEWGFQLAYSTTTAHDFKRYSKKLMMENLLKNFASQLSYKDGEFEYNKLEEYIDWMKKSIQKAESAIRDIYSRNIISKNDEHLCKSAVKSNSLVGSIVTFTFLKKCEIDNSKIRKWFLLQLINKRAEKGTDKIVDELISQYEEFNEKDFDNKIKKSIKFWIENSPSATSHVQWLWALFYMQYNQIKEYSLETPLEIDHINSRKILKNLVKDSTIDKNAINNIMNLTLMKKEYNRIKSSNALSHFLEKNQYKIPNLKNKMLKVIAFDNEIEFNKLILRTQDIEDSIKEKNTKKGKINYELFLEERKKILEELLQ